MLIVLQAFGGERPSLDPRLLGATEAQAARNCKLWRGTLHPWYRPIVSQATFNPGPTRSIYRFSDAGYWLHWPADVDVARGPIAGSQRLYWTGDGVPKFGNAEAIAGVTTLVSAAAGGNNFLIVNNSRGFSAGDSITITLDSGSHTTSITTVQQTLNRINLLIAMPGPAAIGKAVVNNNKSYPHGSYSLGVPAPAATVSAVVTTASNSGTVVGFVGMLGEQTGAPVSANGIASIDLTGLDSNGDVVDFEIDASFTGPIASVQTNNITIRVFRDPAGDNEQIFEKSFTSTFQGPAAVEVPGNLNQTSNIDWGLYLAAITGEFPQASTNQNLHFKYAPADGPHTYRLTFTHGFQVADGQTWTYALRLSAKFFGEFGIILNNDTHGLKEGDRVQFAGVVGTGTVADLNKDPLVITRVDGATVYVQTNATGVYTSGGTWAQVWEDSDLEARSYLYTYVAELDGVEMEGPPSPPSAITLAGDNQFVTLSGFIDPTSLADDRPYSAIRVYRTSTGDDTDAEFLFVAEIAFNSASYIDTLRGTALGEPLPSTLWSPPPDDLVGIIELPNGGLAGFRAGTNELCLCEPYQPHSWPAAYRHSMLDNIIGIAAFGISIFVGTKGRPTVVVGNEPGSLSEEHIEVVHPVLSKRGIVDMGYGILYPTLTGLCYVAEGQASIVTRDILTEDQWKALNPASFIAAKYGDRYICFYDNGTEQAGFILDPRSPNATLVFLDLSATEVWSDPRTDRLYMVRVSNAGTEEIVEWNADTTATPQAYRWRSKEFILSQPSAARALKVDAETYPVLINLYADGQVYDSIPVASSAAMRVRDAKGRARKWEVEVVGDTNVEAVYVASSMRQLTQYLST